jgi:outer membrane protein assembly factor BamB
MTSGPIDGTSLEVGLGGAWSASSSGVVFLSVPSAKPQVVRTPGIDDVALNSTHVFALSDQAQKVFEVDPGSRRVVRTWTFHHGTPNALTATDTHMYVSFLGSPNALESIDLRTGATVSRTIPHTVDPTHGRVIAYGDHTLWLTDGTTLVRLDPSTLAVRGATRMVADPINCGGVVWFGDGSPWFSCTAADTGVFRISPQTGRVVARQLTRGAIQLAFSPTAVWATSIVGPTALDPKTARIEWTVPPSHVPGGDSAGIALIGGQVWVTYFKEMDLQRFPAALAH